MKINQENNITKKKSLLRIIGEGSAVTTIGSILLKIVVILSTIIILRYISVYDYGLWQLILGAVGFVSLFTLPGFENVLLADLSKEIGGTNKRKSKAILIQSSVLFIGMGLLAAVVLFIVAPTITFISKIDLTYFLRILSIYFVFISVQRIYSLIFNSHLQFFYIQSMKIVNRLSYLILLSFFIFYMDKDLIGVVYAYVFSVFFSTIIFFPFCVRTLSYLKEIVTDNTYSLWHTFRTYGKWALFTGYFNNLFGSTRPWIIGYFIGVEAVAVFAVAVTLFGEVMNILPLRQIFAPVIPRYVENKEKFKFLYERTIKYSLWFYGIVGVGAYLVAPYFVGMLFPKYVSSLPFFNILLISLVALPFGVITMQTFYAMKAQKKLFVSTVIPKSIGILILPILLIPMGLYGAAFVQIGISFGVGYMRVRYLSKMVPELSFSLKKLVVFDQKDNFLLQRVIGAGLMKYRKNINSS